MKLKLAIEHIRHFYYTSGNTRYIKYLKSSGVKIGDNVIFRHPCSTRIDITRPSLISIGNDVDINMNFQILTHDWVCGVFRNYYSDFVNSSGKVTIGNNIYFGIIYHKPGMLFYKNSMARQTQDNSLTSPGNSAIIIHAVARA